ncbi:MAG: hypothetical protein ACREU2_05885 [Steroidobacteraceae bacterium]
MKFLYATAALAALAVAPVYAACTAPGPAPAIPDASSATPDDILQSQKAVLAFNSATTTYLTCVKKEHDDAISAAGPGITTVEADKIDHAEDQQHDAAVKQLNSVVGRFNALVNGFKAKQAAAAAAAKAKKK